MSADDGFIPIFLPKQRRGREGYSPITLTDSYVLWLLWHYQHSGFTWRENREHVLAKFSGIDKKNIGRQLGRLTRYGWVDDTLWGVSIDRISPDWFVDFTPRRKRRRVRRQNEACRPFYLLNDFEDFEEEPEHEPTA
jgi:hypothetical protein